MAFSTEELEPPTGSIKNGKWTSTRSIWLRDPTQLDDYVADLLGVSFAAGEGAVQGVSQTFPGKPWLILVDANYEPHGDKKIGGQNYAGTLMDATDSDGVAQPTNGYDFTLDYQTPTFDQGTLGDPNNQDLPPTPVNTFLTVKWDLAMMVLATEKSAYEWVTTNDAGSQALGVKTDIAAFRPGKTLTLIWHRVPFPPWTNIYALSGKINDAVFMGQLPGNVMFVGLVGQREFQVNGVRQWQLDYKFSIKSVPYTDPVLGEQFAGWNEFLRKDPGANDPEWQLILHKVTGNPLFLEGDFNRLFVLET